MWEDISKAPKDGTRIVCNNPPCAGEKYTIGYYDGNGWMAVSIGQFDGDEPINPTKFMLIPETI